MKFAFLNKLNELETEIDKALNLVTDQKFVINTLEDLKENGYGGPYVYEHGTYSDNTEFIILHIENGNLSLVSSDDIEEENPTIELLNLDLCYFHTRTYVANYITSKLNTEEIETDQLGPLVNIFIAHGVIMNNDDANNIICHKSEIKTELEKIYGPAILDFQEEFFQGSYHYLADIIYIIQFEPDEVAALKEMLSNY